MKTNLGVSDKNILGVSFSDEEIEILKDDLQQNIDKDIFERYENDYEFKMVCDYIMNNKKEIDIEKECKDICNRIYIARNITMNADEIEEQMRRIDRLLREPNWN
jgi:hypothetical protein